MSAPMMSIDDVTMMLRTLGAMFGIGEELLKAARQGNPILREDDPGPLDAVEQARAEALARVGGAGK